MPFINTAGPYELLRFAGPVNVNLDVWSQPNRLLSSAWMMGDRSRPALRTPLQL